MHVSTGVEILAVLRPQFLHFAWHGRGHTPDPPQFRILDRILMTLVSNV